MLGLCEFGLGHNTDALKHIQHGRQPVLAPSLNCATVMLYHEGLLLLGKGDFERAQETLSVLSQEGVENEELTTALGLSALRARFSDLTWRKCREIREVVHLLGWAEHLAAEKKFDGRTQRVRSAGRRFSKACKVKNTPYGRFLISTNQDEKGVAAVKANLRIHRTTCQPDPAWPPPNSDSKMPQEDWRTLKRQ